MNKDRQGRIKKEIQESELYKIYNEEGLCNGEFHAESLATAIAKEYVRRDEVQRLKEIEKVAIELEEWRHSETGYQIDLVNLLIKLSNVLRGDK